MWLINSLEGYTDEFQRVKSKVNNAYNLYEILVL